MKHIIPLFLALFFITFPGYCEEELYKAPIKFFEKETLPRKETADKTQEKDKTKEEKKEVVREDPWIEPIIGPDGRVNLYRPPQVVIDFLEKPTKENIEKYLEWNKKKLEMVNTGYASIRDYLRSTGQFIPYYSSNGLVYNLEEIQSVGGIDNYLKKTGGVRALYFTKTGCPYCDVQDKELEAYLSANKLAIKGIRYGGENNKKYSFPVAPDNGDVDKYNIKFFPTMLLFMPDGRSFRIEGGITSPELSKIISQLATLQTKATK